MDCHSNIQKWPAYPNTHSIWLYLTVILELTLLAIYGLKTMNKRAKCTYLFLLSEPPSQSILFILLQSLSNRNSLLKHSHKMWNNAYLHLLFVLQRKYKKYLGTYIREQHIYIDVGDIFLIRHTQKSRQFWMLGEVVEVFKCDDNKIRSANVKRDGWVQHYSINHSYPLELEQLTNESLLSCNNDKINETTSVGPLHVKPVRRSVRLRAQNSKSQWTFSYVWCISGLNTTDLILLFMYIYAIFS